MPDKGRVATAAVWAGKSVAMVRAAGDSRVAAGARAYFKSSEHLDFFGVRASRVREIEREVYRAVRSSWAAEDAVLFCDSLIRERELETKFLGILLLSRYARHCDRDLAGIAHGWLCGGFCTNWATTDSLSTLLLAPLLARFPDLLDELRCWTRSKDLWVRRAAAVSLTPLTRRGEHLDAAYAISLSLMNCPEDLIHKAVGWLLRECGKTDMRRLEAFLMAQGSLLPRTALRYAIERFPQERRRRLLEGTKSGLSESTTSEDS